MDPQQTNPVWQQWDKEQQNQFGTQFILPFVLFSWRSFSLQYLFSVILQQLLTKKVIILDTTQIQSQLSNQAHSFSERNLVQKFLKMNVQEQMENDEFVSSCSPHYSSNRIFVFSEDKFHYRIALLRLMMELVDNPNSPHFQSFKLAIQIDQNVLHKCLFILFQTGASLLCYHPKFTLPKKFANKTLAKLWRQQSIFSNWMKKKITFDHLQSALENKFELLLTCLLSLLESIQSISSTSVLTNVINQHLDNIFKDNELWDLYNNYHEQQTQWNAFKTRQETMWTRAQNSSLIDHISEMLLVRNRLQTLADQYYKGLQLKKQILQLQKFSALEKVNIILSNIKSARSQVYQKEFLIHFKYITHVRRFFKLLQQVHHLNRYMLEQFVFVNSFVLENKRNGPIWDQMESIQRMNLECLELEQQYQQLQNSEQENLLLQQCETSWNPKLKQLRNALLKILFQSCLWDHFMLLDEEVNLSLDKFLQFFAVFYKK